MSKLTPSQEDYLETIYLEAEKNGCAKVTDIAKLLDVKKASVTGALSNLCEKGLINYAALCPDYPLLQKVKKEQKKILQRHEVMSVFLKNILHLSEDESTLNACRMEHIMTEEMFSRTNSFLAFIQDYCSKNQDFSRQIENLYK